MGFDVAGDMVLLPWQAVTVEAAYKPSLFLGQRAPRIWKYFNLCEIAETSLLKQLTADSLLEEGIVVVYAQFTRGGRLYPTLLFIFIH